jgi:hypothetical protein
MPMNRDQLREMCRESIDRRHDDTFTEQAGRGLAYAVIILDLLDEIDVAEVELGRLREVAATLTAAAEEAERYLGDVAAYERMRTNEGRVGTLLGRAIAMARGEQGS